MTPPEGISDTTDKRLAAIDDLPVDQHPAVFEAMHRDLSAALDAGASASSA